MDHHDHVALLRPANLRPGGSWADLGAGSGAFTLALRELVGAQAEFYAVDRERARLGELERAWHMRFGDTTGLHLLRADFTQPLDLPRLDGVLMANSLHFIRDADERGERGETDFKTDARRSFFASHPPDKLSVLRHVGIYLKPGGRLLLVEYNVDLGNLWVPYPLSYGTFQKLAVVAGFQAPRLLGMHPSSFLRGFYSAEAFLNVPEEF